MCHRQAHALRWLLVLSLAAATACGGLLRAGPTIPPLISARYLSVHLVIGETADAQEKARLPTLRDSLAGALPAAWATATQGRGQLFLRNEGDIDVELAGTNGTSALTQHSRGGKVTSRTITVHTVDGSRRLSIPDLMSTTLHELGHIWCCYGPEANETGHWATKQASPGLYGVDKYGLMTDPVTCVSFGAVLSCPNRFSDREMVALGFTNFPPPAPDPCITQALSLQSQITSLGVQIRAIEAQYPRGIPSSIYDSYVAMVSQYNSLVGRRNALPCDAS